MSSSYYTNASRNLVAFLLYSELFNRLYGLFGDRCKRNDLCGFTIRLYRDMGGSVDNVASLCFTTENDIVELTIYSFIPHIAGFNHFEHSFVFSSESPSFFDDIVNLCSRILDGK